MNRHQAEQAAPLVGSGPALLVIALSALPMVLPFSEGPVASLLVPHLVFIPVFFLTLAKREGVGPIGAFAAGLAVDVLTFGPLGVTAAGYVLAHFVIRHEREGLRMLPAAFRLAAFAGALALVLALNSLALVFAGPGNASIVDLAFAFVGLLLAGVVFEALSRRYGEPETKSGLGGGNRNRPRRSAMRKASPSRRKLRPRGGLAARRS